MKRTRGTGSVFQRTYKEPKTGERRVSSTWSIQFYDRLGRLQRESGFTTKVLAERALRKRLGAKDEGRDSGPSIERTRFEDLAQLIRDDYEANGNRSTKRLEQGLSHLEDFFAGERASRIMEDRVIAYMAKRRRDRAAAASINYELAILKRAFRLGARAGRVGRRPDIVLLRLDNARKGFFEEPQFRAVLQHLPDDVKPVAIVAYYTGWRVRSEILTRQWKHVDLKAGWLRLEPGETKGPRRRPGRQFSIDACRELRATFEELHKLNEARKRERKKIVPWVFHRDGEPIRYFRAAWMDACVKAGLATEVKDKDGAVVKVVTTRVPHDFRRTAVRNLERAAVPRSTAMAMVGHQTESMYRRYAISDETSLREGAAKMAEWVDGPAAAPTKKSE